MRGFHVLALCAFAILLAGCATIDTYVSRRVQLGDDTFVVIEHGQIHPAGDFTDDEDTTAWKGVYQVTPDGRYRQLGDWRPSTTYSAITEGSGVGVYSEADRKLVDEVLKKAGEDKNNYLTKDGKNVGDIETAVAVITGRSPTEVASPGSLIYENKPLGYKPAPSTGGGAVGSGGSAIGNTIDDSQGD